MTDECHKWGALAGVELGAGGVKDNLQSRYVAAAFDRFPSGGIPKVYTYAAREEDIRRVMQMYADAARRAIDAGFDILYIHGAAGVFPAHALSRHFNRRKDGYGGSFENRARFWIEALETIREVADGQCAIATRIAIDDLSGPWGMEMHDEGLRFVELVTKQGLLDLWDVIIGGSGEDKWGEDSGPSRFYKSQPPGALEFRGQAHRQCAGGGRRPLHRSRRDGAGDQIRPDRHHRRRAALHRRSLPAAQDRRGPHRGHLRMHRLQYLHLALQPRQHHHLHPEPHGDGGIPPRLASRALRQAGAQPRPRWSWAPVPPGWNAPGCWGCAAIASSLVEAETTLGGHLRDVIRLPGLAEWGRVITYREGQLARMANVEILRGAGMVTAADVLDFGAARIVLATGARWVGDGLGAMGPDPVPGAAAEHGYCVTPEQFFAGKPIGQRVVILDSDGYFMASSIAERLADQGKQVTIVTQLEKVAPMTDLTLEGFNMKRMMREKGIHERIGHWVELLRPAGNQVEVVAYDLYRDGSRRTTEPTNGVYPRRLGNAVEILECDTVILCTARESRTELYDSLYERRGEWGEKGIEAIVRAGDCLAPRYLADAIFDGHRIAREFESADPERPKAVIRERQVWGQEVYPKLGDPVL